MRGPIIFIKWLDTPKETLMTKSRQQAKTLISEQMCKFQIDKLYREAEEKSKVREYVTMREGNENCKRKSYLNTLTRRQCTNLMKVRSRMLHVKGNYKNKYPDLMCRWCKKHSETQQHVLSKCTHFRRVTNNITYKAFFEDNMDTIKITTRALEQIIPQIDTMNNES